MISLIFQDTEFILEKSNLRFSLLAKYLPFLDPKSCARLGHNTLELPQYQMANLPLAENFDCLTYSYNRGDNEC